MSIYIVQSLRKEIASSAYHQSIDLVRRALDGIRTRPSHNTAGIFTNIHTHICIYCSSNYINLELSKIAACTPAANCIST